MADLDENWPVTLTDAQLENVYWFGDMLTPADAVLVLAEVQRRGLTFDPGG